MVFISDLDNNVLIFMLLLFGLELKIILFGNKSG